MLENGMIIGESTHDVQNRFTNTFICTICREEIPTYDKVEGLEICTDCIGDYCKLRAKDPDILSGYIADHEEDFYLGCYFESLSQKDKLHLVKKIYMETKTFERMIKSDRLSVLEQDYCLENDDFFYWLREV